MVHGWGSTIGFEYARRHPDTIKGIVFYEAHVRPITHWNMLSLPLQQLSYLLADQTNVEQKIIKENFLLSQFFSDCMIKQLDPQDLMVYRKPFQTEQSRRPLLQYIQELPMGKKRGPVLNMIKQYSQFLQQSPIPKCMLYAMPGFNTTIDTVIWCKEQLKNLTVTQLRHAFHYAQESIPQEFAQALITWHQKQYQSKKTLPSMKDSSE